MNKVLLSFGFLFIASCALVGGWSKLDANNLGSGAKGALQVAISNIKQTLSATSDSVNFQSLVSASSQVVAGIKYKFQLQFSVLIEGDEMFLKRYEAVVWQQPAGYNGANSAESYVVLSVTSLDGSDNNTLNLAIAGGWSNINSNNLDAWASSALKAAISQVESLFTQNSPNLVGVQSAQTQIVAGQNYKFLIQFDLGTFEVVVWRKLDGSLLVTQTTQVNSGRRLGSTAGGWSKLDINNLDDWARQASAFAVSVSTSKSDGDLLEIKEASSQIVAGTNYKFIIAFSNGDSVSVTVWRRLDGSFQVTNVALVKKLGVAGGWTNLDANSLDAWAEEAANAAVGHVKVLLQSTNGQFDSIEFAASQVVAGTNYKFHLQFFGADGGRIHYEVVVWRQLSGKYVVTSALVAN